MNAVVYVNIQYYPNDVKTRKVLKQLYQINSDKTPFTTEVEITDSVTWDQLTEKISKICRERGCKFSDQVICHDSDSLLVIDSYPEEGIHNNPIIMYIS